MSRPGPGLGPRACCGQQLNTPTCHPSRVTCHVSRPRSAAATRTKLSQLSCTSPAAVLQLGRPGDWSPIKHLLNIHRQQPYYSICPLESGNINTTLNLILLNYGTTQISTVRAISNPIIIFKSTFSFFQHRILMFFSLVNVHFKRQYAIFTIYVRVCSISDIRSSNFIIR